VGETLKIGFVGSGLIAWAHALAIGSMVEQGTVDAQIVSVFDTDPSRAAGFATHNRATVARSAEEVAETCDAVFVCTSTAGHLHAVEAAVGCARAVFCEKPLARDLAEAERLAAVVEARAIPVQVGLVLRTAPVFRGLREVVRSGAIGRPMAVVFRDDQFFPIQGHYGSRWRADAAIAGSGALLEHSIHDVDIMRMCFGAIASLSATTGNFAGHGGIEDVAVGTIRFASSVLATLVSVWHNVLVRPSSRRVEVFFENGYVSFDDDFTGPLTIETSVGTEIRQCPPADWVAALGLPLDAMGLSVRTYAAEDRSFLDALAAGTRPSPGLDEALAAHRVVDAWYRSAAAGGARIEGPW